MSDTTVGSSGHGATRLAILVMVSSMALASLVAWHSIQAPGASRLERRGESLPERVAAVAAGPSTPSLIDRGAALAREQCAGCHEVATRMVGPPWKAIARKYAAMAASDSICGDGRGLVGNAASHPPPGWNGYPPGPTDIALSAEDRAALGAWVISMAKGAGK